jgi:phosphoglycerate dehydrogenase-like enzyme
LHFQVDPWGHSEKDHQALKSRRILGASIDMTEVVPMPVDNPLLKLYNITVTPRVTGYTLESQYKTLFLEVARGLEPKSLVPVD